jgi:predicted DNA binding CopG/RHH family protein
VPEKRRQSFMKKKTLAKSSTEFDRRFDSGEDIHDLIDMSRATVIHHGKKVRITLDIAESLVKDIDAIREKIGVDRGALIKVWLHEKVKQEKARAGV